MSHEPIQARDAVDARPSPRARPRIPWLDNLKGLVITLVVIGHVTGVPESLKEIIHSFNMPTSFFLSGVLFSPTKYATILAFVRVRANRLLKPFFLYALLSFGLYVAVFRSFENTFDPISAASSIVLATPATLHITHVTAIWFLPCLFLTELLYLVAARVLRGDTRVVAAACAMMALGFLIPVRLPWSADTACIAIGYFAFGKWLGARLHLWTLAPRWGAIALTALFAAVLWFDLSLDLAKRIYSPASLILPFATITALAVTFRHVPGLVGLEFFGRNSLIILGTHNLVLLALRFLFDIALKVTLTPLVTTALFASIVMACMVPVVHIVNRRARWMAGF